MSEFDKEQYKHLKEEFLKVSKRILKENLGTVPATLNKYKADIINVHNALMNYIIHYSSQAKIQKRINLHKKENN